MQKIKELKEIDNALKLNNEYVVTKDNENNIVIMSIEEYQKQQFDDDVVKKLEQSEKDIENGDIISAKEVFREMREEYGY